MICVKLKSVQLVYFLFIYLFTYLFIGLLFSVSAKNQTKKLVFKGVIDQRVWRHVFGPSVLC